MEEKTQFTNRSFRPTGKILSALFKAFILCYAGIQFFWYDSPQSDEIDPEAIVLQALSSNYAGNWSEKYTSEAHLPGTNWGFVEWTKGKFEEFGFKASIDTYDIFVSYPNEHDLNLLDADGNTIYKAPLKEDEIEEDKTSTGDGRVPTFLAYAANGNVTAQYVYANYGTQQDFEHLKELGVDIAGKIAIIRYGAIFRGLKVKFAQENGAIGVLLFTDPGDDFGITPANGFKQYPHGPARHESSVQRGSVQFLGGIGGAPGDPTTPGYASKGDVPRVDPHEHNIGSIPVLPISYREVTPILETLNKQGHKSPKEWHGELQGYDYHIGPSANHTLNLYNDQIYNITPLWNIYGEIEGKNKDEVIVIGNHRDAWIKGGAGDPNSGSAALLEIARALGELKKAGYEFKRSIVLQSYDGEEYGLLGSTEYGEFAAKSLQKKVVAYFNMDVAVRGKHLHLSASPVLNALLRETAKKLEYPEEGVGSLYDHFVAETGDKIHNLGSGSDYTVFLEHLGIPSVDFGFGQGKGDPIYQYHSNYDSFYWMSEFADPGFVYHNLAAKYLALAALELSEHQVIKFGAADYAKDLLKYFNETVDLIPKEWFSQKVHSTELLQHDLENNQFVYEATSRFYHHDEVFPFPELLQSQCTHHKIVQHRGKNITLELLVQLTYQDLVELQDTSDAFDITSVQLQQEYDESAGTSPWHRIRLYFKIKHHNKLLQYFERNFLFHKGLDQRSWFKHIVFASGRFTGYAGQTWPGIREAIEDEDFDRLVKWLGIVSKTLRRVSATLV